MNLYKPKQQLIIQTKEEFALQIKTYDSACLKIVYEAKPVLRAVNPNNSIFCLTCSLQGVDCVHMNKLYIVILQQSHKKPQTQK